MPKGAIQPAGSLATWSRGRADWSDRAVAVVVWLTALAVTGVFVWILADVLRHGVSGLSWGFLIDGPRDAGRAGGIGPMIVSTLLVLMVCLAVSAPIGVGTAVWLAEFARGGGLLGRLVRRSLDVLAGVPSIVFGLFGNALFCIYLGMGFSILSGGLTLSCMVLPLLIRSCEAGLRAVPDEYRRAAEALGLSRSAVLWRILLPAATPGLVVGLVLGVGRALGETAALLFTSGYVDRMPGSLMDSGRTLSVHIYDLAMNVPGGQSRAYATAIVLISLLMIVNTLTCHLADRWLHRRITRT